LIALPGRADDFKASDELYFHRNEPGKLEQNIQGLTGSDAGTLWRLCRAKVRRGETLKKKSDKMAEYDSADKDCEKSIALSSGTADAHFWLGVGLGRWAETKGMMKALFALKTIKKEMAETLRLDPQHGGAHHVLGEILWQVPGIAGGDKKKALSEFELAVKLSPTHSANYLPLAEAYLYFDRKDEARKTAEALSAIKDVADPAEYPDNLADAKVFLEKLDKK
jgi:tetratricopeptide (TPR) repeat protein